jgi:hypothetical protein
VPVLDGKLPEYQALLPGTSATDAPTRDASSPSDEEGDQEG